VTENASLDISHIRFERNHPEAFVELLPEIQDLRQEYYEWGLQPDSSLDVAVNPIDTAEPPETEPLPGRTTAEVVQYLARLTTDVWCDPDISARDGLNRFDPQVTVAFDRDTEQVMAYS
jgi:hypothetical protein